MRGRREPQPACKAVDKILEILRRQGIDLDDCPEQPDEPRRMDALTLAAARIPWMYQDAVADHPQVQDWLRQVKAAARRGPGGVPGIARSRSLLLLGPTGTGKTYQAYGAVRSLLGDGVRLGWRATTAADLNATMRLRQGHDGEEEFGKLKRTPLLILDDLGAATSNAWTDEHLYRLVNYRYNEMLPTILTSNLDTDELERRLGDRVVSRLSQMCDVAVLDGADRRFAAHGTP